ncbi:zf-HC2 domain-containing protein [Vreelandella neptunia]|uniref:zf-HC2 domain-containing protein n=1 Tax=Vreelandella neptunia TaxID=115551 RepID=UPI00315AAF3F
MLMCREATALISLKQDKTLSLRDKLSLRIHLSMCQACRTCARQFDLLHQVGNHHPASQHNFCKTLDD